MLTGGEAADVVNLTEGDRGLPIHQISAQVGVELRHSVELRPAAQARPSLLTLRAITELCQRQMHRARRRECPSSRQDDIWTGRRSPRVAPRCSKGDVTGSLTLEASSNGSRSTCMATNFSVILDLTISGGQPRQFRESQNSLITIPVILIAPGDKNFLDCKHPNLYCCTQQPLLSHLRTLLLLVLWLQELRRMLMMRATPPPSCDDLPP